MNIQYYWKVVFASFYICLIASKKNNIKQSYIKWMLEKIQQ